MSSRRSTAQKSGGPAGIHPGTVAVAVASLAVLVVLHRVRPRWPAALLVVAAGTAVGSAAAFADHGIAVVGQIPRSLPAPSLPSASAAEIGELLGPAVAITILGFVESIAIAKVFARRLGYTIRANQELVAVGAATVAAGVMGGYPVSGSFSRTAVNARAGARTQLAGVVTAAVVVAATVVAAPLFRSLPKAVLAAVVIAAVAGLVDVGEARRLWRLKRSEFWLMLLAFAGTLVLGVELGLGLAVAASLAGIVRQVTRPHTAVLGRLPGSGAFRNIDRFPEAQTEPGLAVLRFDAPLYFANVEFFRERLRKLELQSPGGLRALVIDATAINDLDASGEAALAELAADYQARGIHLSIAQAKGPVLDLLRRSGLYHRLGAERFPLTDDEAVHLAEAHLARTDPTHPPPVAREINQYHGGRAHAPGSRPVAAIRPGSVHRLPPCPGSGRSSRWSPARSLRSNPPTSTATAKRCSSTSAR